jgi:charged multivesicular body protein 6
VEFSLVQKDVYFGLQRGTEVLKEINKEMGGLEGVERLMEDTAEAQEEQRRIGEALAGELNRDEVDEVEDELEQMEREMLPDAPRKTVVGEGVMPDAPDTVLEGERDREKGKVGEQRVALEAS